MMVYLGVYSCSICCRTGLLLAAALAGVVVVMVHIVFIDEFEKNLEADEEEQEAQAGPRWRRDVDPAYAVAAHSISLSTSYDTLASQP